MAEFYGILATEIDKLNQDIQKLQGEKNALLIEIQQKQHEIHNLQNMLTETISAAEKNHERLIKEKEDEASNKHNIIMAEKNNEMQDIIQKYQDLETRFNQLRTKFLSNGTKSYASNESVSQQRPLDWQDKLQRKRMKKFNC